MKPLYIFDLDGTLALIEHRRHLLEPGDRERWDRFHAACDQDPPNRPVIATMEALRRNGADIWIFSGRNAAMREKTIAWLTAHTSFTPDELELALHMRQVGDYTEDDAMKRLWLERTLLEDRERLVAVFDDRDRVVAMWRAEGVPCFQVAPGDF
jgi:hypothetical protein